MFTIRGKRLKVPIVLLTRALLGAMHAAVEDVAQATASDSDGGSRITRDERRAIALQFGSNMAEALLSAWGIPVDLPDGPSVATAGGFRDFVNKASAGDGAGEDDED